MKFEQEDDITYAVKKDSVYKGKVHEELMFAEVIQKRVLDQDAFEVHWEDNWMEPVTFESLDTAKQYVLDNFENHVPHSNGKSYDVKEL